MRIIFMGTPEFSVAVLGALAAAGHDIAAVYTRAPKPGGRRGLDLTLSPVHASANKLGLPVFTPKSLRSEEEAALFAGHKTDVAVVVAYGLLLPKTILAAPRLGCLNLHASLLPRWRGAAPIQRAIMAGDARSGIMLMQMEEGLDTGPVGAAAEIAIDAAMTAGDLQEQLAQAGANLIVQSLALLAQGKLHFTAQGEAGVTYAKKIEKSECRIDWSKTAVGIRNQIHGLSPFPGAFFEIDFGKGPERVKVLRCAVHEGAGAPGAVLDDQLTIACGAGALRLLSVQRAGKPPMAAQDFLRGARIVAGTKAF